LEKYKGKLVEIIVREKKESKKKKLNKFFSLCGKVSLDSSEIDKLREASYIGFLLTLILSLISGKAPNRKRPTFLTIMK